MAYTRASLSGACCTSCAHGGSCLGDGTPATPAAAGAPRNMLLVGLGIAAVAYLALRRTK